MPTRLSYLEAYNDVLTETQQDRLLEVLRNRFEEADATPDDATLQTEIKKLIAELEKELGEPLTQYRKATSHGKISSKDYNSTMEEVFVDLGALFKQDNTIELVIQRHELINKASLRDIRAALRKVKNDVRVNTIVKENKTGITDAKFNDFYKDDNLSQDPVFFAWIDTDTNSCKLPKGLDQSVLSYQGLASADINLRHYGGGIRGMIESEDHRKEKAIDGNANTFWGDVFLTDEPIIQNYDGEEMYGAICEISINLFRPELINHVKFAPYANYPLTVYKLQYRLNEEQPWTDIDVPSQTSTQIMEFNFPETEAKEVRIIINQQNPSINTYKIPRSTINNAEMWQQIADRELSISTETTVPIQATQDMIDYVTGWQAYTDAIERYGTEMRKNEKLDQDETLGETIFDVTTDQITKAEVKGADELKLDIYGKKAPKTDELVEVRKYEYMYGAYEISVKRLWYVDKGEYVSPKYISNGSILEAEIGVEEELPEYTSIEYSLSTDGDTWKSVLPSGSYVQQERVDIDPITQQGILRFPTTSALLDNVYRNRYILPSGTHAQIDPSYFGPSGYYFDESTNTITVASGWYIGTSAYTASYAPAGAGDVVPSGLVVDFSKEAVSPAEDVYDSGASRNYKVELTHNPFIDWRIVNDTNQAYAAASGFAYTEGRWLNISGSELYGIQPNEYYDIFIATVEGYPAENRTDYYNDIRPALTQYDNIQYPYYEYFQSGKSLYFNTKIEDKEIKVKYKYLNDYIQFRALLRNNNTANVTYTPILHNYTLKLRTA
jgi:hypothetical protein